VDQKVESKPYRKAYNTTDIMKNNSTSCFSFPKYFHSLFRIPSAGESLNPNMITRNASSFETDLQFRQGLTQNGLEYWRVGVPSTVDPNGLRELKFYVLSDKYSPVTLDISVVTFYVSVVYLAGRILRMVTGGSAENFIMTEMPMPDKLLAMCDAVFLARMAGDLVNEEKFFYELVDIVRSPEMLKVFTGRSSTEYRGKAKTE
jgi:hypothetical protein